MISKKQNNDGEIITFYSYKGGTGRTMALVNSAVLKQQDISDSKILLIDWDLEAPGLHRFLYKHLMEFRSDDELENKLGLIDFFKKVREEVQNKINSNKAGEEISTKEITAEKLVAEDITGIFEEIEINDYITETSIKGIYFMKAGAFTDEYSENINKFDWEELFKLAPHIFRVFSEYLKSFFQYIFIDSRTGLTDTSGICTILLPEKLCLVFTPNMQSLLGVKNIAEKALGYRRKSSDFRPLMIYPIPSRVELAEKDLKEEWRLGSDKLKFNGYQQVFEEIFDKYYGLKNSDLTQYFDSVQIHHVPKYSYGEEIAVLNEKSTGIMPFTTKKQGRFFQSTHPILTVIDYLRPMHLAKKQ